jgi:hypothetical protein
MKDLDQYVMCSHDEAEFFHKARQAAQLADTCGGEEKKKQVGGSHYQVAAIQPWDIMAAYGLDPWSANVVKYILRFPYKAGRQDLEKAQHYIEYLITHYDEVKDTYYD